MFDKMKLSDSKGKKGTIEFKIFAPLFIMTVVTILFVIFLTVSYRSLLFTEALNQGENSMLELKSGIEADESIALVHSKQIADSEEYINYIVNGDTANLSYKMGSLVKSIDPDYIIITDKDGKLIVSTGDDGSADYKNSACVSAALQGRSASGIETNLNSKMGAYAASPIYDADADLIGVCCVGYDYESTSFVDELKEKSGYEYTLFLDDTRINTTLLNDNNEREINTKANSKVYESVKSGKKHAEILQIFGTKYASVYEPIESADGKFLGMLFSGVSIEGLERSTNIIIAISGISLAIIVILLLFFSITFVKKNIIRPVIGVTGIADRLSKGDLGIESGKAINLDIKSNDEIGIMANSLTKTTDMLKKNIGEISNVLQTLASGDLTVKAVEEYHGDFIQLKDALDHIVSQMNIAFAKINISAEEVASGAEQVSSAAQELSQGSTEQASEIEQLSNLIKDITKRITLNAEHATEVNSLASQADTATMESKETMDTLKEEMNRIYEVTKEMEKVVKTIDDFAFQTNVLALNAAVEAARAGAYGKGFAVVADEVRSLANKSAKAAQETNELIENTISTVEKGVKLADKSSKYVINASEMTEQIKEKIDNIAVASNDQAEAAAQITTSVDEISRVIQTNSATAEESAAASEELNSLAQSLKMIVSNYKLDETYHASNNSGDFGFGSSVSRHSDDDFDSSDKY